MKAMYRLARKLSAYKPVCLYIYSLPSPHSRGSGNSGQELLNFRRRYKFWQKRFQVELRGRSHLKDWLYSEPGNWLAEVKACNVSVYAEARGT